jgi:hypothetical protein
MLHRAIAVAGVTCPDPTWSVGIVHPEERRHLSHTFTLQNQTDKPIPVNQVTSSCGCVVAKDRPSEIPANGSVGINVGFTLSPVPGSFRHSVQVKLGAGELAALALNIRGVVAPTARLYASPTSLDFGYLSDTESRTRSVRVMRYDLSSVEVTRLTTNLKACALEAQPVSDGEAILLTVTLSGRGLHPGLNSGEAVLETDNPTFPSFAIPIQAHVTAVTDPFVSAVLIDSLAPGSRQEISLYRADLPIDERPQIEHIEYNGDPELQIELSSGPNPYRKAIVGPQMSASPDARSGVKKGVLRIALAHRPSPVNVPVIAFVR